MGAINRIFCQHSLAWIHNTSLTHGRTWLASPRTEQIPNRWLWGVRMPRGGWVKGRTTMLAGHWRKATPKGSYACNPFESALSTIYRTLFASRTQKCTATDLTAYSTYTKQRRHILVVQNITPLSQLLLSTLRIVRWYQLHICIQVSNGA